MAGRLLCFLFPVVFGVSTAGLYSLGIASYEQVVALVAETHIIREQLSGLGIAHVLDEYHAVILQYLFLFRGLVLAPKIVSLIFSCLSDCLNAMSLMVGST